MSNVSATDVDLKNYDIELFIDRSGSMDDTDCSGKSRWDWAKEQTVSFARNAAKWDSDGIIVNVFWGDYKTYENVTPETVANIFNEQSPNGSTDTAKVLEARLEAYRQRHAAGNAKPVIFLVVTDGEPSDRKAVRDTIVKHTQWMSDDAQTGIQFIQVGSDSKAAAFLTELDDNLVSKDNAKFDIVDTKTFAQAENMTFEELAKSALSD